MTTFNLTKILLLIFSSFSIISQVISQGKQINENINTKIIPIEETNTKAKTKTKLKTSNTDFDFFETQILIEHSLHTYDPKRINKFSKLENITSIYHEKENIFIEVGIDRQIYSIVVAFRGTVWFDDDHLPDLDNLWRDLMICQESKDDLCENCKIHKGFLKNYMLIDKDLRNILNEKIAFYEDPSIPIIFTGHSLGGALASLALAFTAKFEAYEYTSLITFGEPRIGNQAYANFVNSKVFGRNFRVTFKNDPIPGLPYKDEYIHEGIEVQFENKDDYKIYDSKNDEDENELDLLTIKNHSGYWLIIGGSSDGFDYSVRIEKNNEISELKFLEN